MQEKKFSNIEGFCPVQRSLEIIGTPWKFLIVNELTMHKKMRFNELKKSINGISEKMLSQSLKQLEADNIIIRLETPNGPNKVEYFLTDIGKKLDPILSSMREWGYKYLDDYPD